jgi:hypothetical protein
MAGEGTGSFCFLRDDAEKGPASAESRIGAKDRVSDRSSISKSTFGISRRTEVTWSGKKDVKLTLRITEGEHSALKELAAPKDLSASFIARSFIRAGIKRQRKHCTSLTDKVSQGVA